MGSGDLSLEFVVIMHKFTLLYFTSTHHFSHILIWFPCNMLPNDIIWSSVSLSADELASLPKHHGILFPRVCRKTDSKYGKRNWYPISIRRWGITRELDRIAALANSSPNDNFRMMIYYIVRYIIDVIYQLIAYESNGDSTRATSFKATNQWWYAVFTQPG